MTVKSRFRNSYYSFLAGMVALSICVTLYFNHRHIDQYSEFIKANRIALSEQQAKLISDHREELVASQKFERLISILALLSIIAITLYGFRLNRIIKRNSENAARRQRQLEEAQKIAKIGNWELNLLTGKLLWSDEIFRIFEIDQTKFGASYEAFLNAIHPDDRESVNSAYTHSLKTREHYQITHRLLMPDGRIKYVEEQCGTDFDRDGKPLRSIGTVQDITRQKQAELKLLQISKMASLGEMSAGVAHEINNPLAIIAGSVELLARYKDNPEKSAAKIDAINRAVTRIKKIVNGLRRYSHTTAGQNLKNHNLGEIVNECISLTTEKAKKYDISVTSTIQSQAPIYCDEVEIEQVVVSLINNAIDAVKNKNEKWIKIEVLDTAQFTTLRVTDSGTGIPENIREKIFYPFFTTKPVGDGTGLGLSICKGILDSHQATIAVIPTVPNTCFEVRFGKMAVETATE